MPTRLHGLRNVFLCASLMAVSMACDDEGERRVSTEISAQDSVETYNATWRMNTPTRTDLEGLSVDYEILDGELLAASARDAGLADVQVEAIEGQRFDIETFTELVELERDCIRSQGIEVTDINIDNSTGFPYPSYGIRTADSSGEQGSVDDISLRCQTHFSGLYGLLYDQVLSPSIEEQLEAFYTRAQTFLECMESEGRDVLPVPTTPEELTAYDEWRTAQEVPAACQNL